jgi:hypothetical protein
MTSKRTSVAVADRPVPARKRLRFHLLADLGRLAQAQPRGRRASGSACEPVAESAASG